MKSFFLQPNNDFEITEITLTLHIPNLASSSGFVTDSRISVAEVTLVKITPVGLLHIARKYI